MEGRRATIAKRTVARKEFSEATQLTVGDCLAPWFSLDLNLRVFSESPQGRIAFFNTLEMAPKYLSTL